MIRSKKIREAARGQDWEPKKVGMLLAVERLPGSKVRCICDCGNERILRVGHFNAEYFKSCGCHFIRHGHSGNGAPSRTYTSYHNMIARCHKPTNKRYKDYGGKGILVCDEWRECFANFLADMGECPDGYTIDRIDNRLGYSAKNCRWATRSDNQANRSVSRIWNVFGVEYLTLAAASVALKVSQAAVRQWCIGRHVGDKLYQPKAGCSARMIY